MRRSLQTVFALSAILMGNNAIAAGDTNQPSMNPYILKAVAYLKANHSNGGYNINSTLTHDLRYQNETIKATNPPKSMCVAAIIETIVESYRLWAEEHNGDEKVYNFLPAASWRSLRPRDIKSHIWVDPRLDAFGTGDAIEKFGIGKRVTFKELEAGDFANINRPAIAGIRSKPSGHAVVFLSFIDDKGHDISEATKSSGIRYFSNQGSTNGFAEKLGFFMKSGKYFCPNVDRNLSKDCGIMFSADQRYLNLGRLYAPENWDAKKRDSYIASLTENLRKKSNSKGPSFIGLPGNLSPQEFDLELERIPDVMSLNPLFINDASE